MSFSGLAFQFTFTLFFFLISLETYLSDWNCVKCVSRGQLNCWHHRHLLSIFSCIWSEKILFFFFLISYIRHPHSLKTIFYLIWFDVSVTFTLKSGISHLTGDHFFPCLYTPKVHITIASCHVLFSSSFFSRVISVWGIQTVLVFVFYHHVI